eukprot:TRINITY_DN49732_c0_g1_i1.p1 TRINITY_DN49732_c0_g1~~TRINITY_DN49732_c0_g1_i1.p1  ORF type:complete len:512 (+),score=78.78 TRINITY_DN49732_c0_g1_i1:39-1538(+)
MAAFCDASVPADIAERLHHWASLNVKSPPLQQLNESFEIRKSDMLGIHAIARRAVKTGDIIISEDPLMCTPPLTAANRKMLQSFGELGAFLAPALAVDWPSVSAEMCKAALELFFAHPDIEKRSGGANGPHMTACRDLLDNCPALRKTGWDASHLLRFLHVMDLNIHKDDEREGNDNFAGIFVLGSKFSHSCSPNSCWTFSRTGQLQYKALRPIAAGELLTFSYVGNGMNLITSTFERRRRLAALCFVCQCSRCTGPDLARQLRCPSCGAHRCTPCYDSQGSRSLAAVSGPRGSAIADASTWGCGACGKKFRSDDMPLKQEEQLASLVPQVMQKPPSDAEDDALQLGRLRAKIEQVLGSNHWTWFLATFAWMQKCLVRLRTNSVIPFSEADLRAASVAVAQWLEATAPYNVEQRLSAFFITARLARQVGEGVRQWGYDPAKPFGDTLEGASKIASLGWNLGEDSVTGPDETPHPEDTGAHDVHDGRRPASRHRFLGDWH